MAKPELLRNQLANAADIQLQADGYALWLFWNDSATPVVIQTLEEYGGIRVAGGATQALYFFFSPEVLLAVARLGAWARFNPLPLGLEVFPARLQVGKDGGRNLIIDESVWQQDIPPPSEYRVWVHGSMREEVEARPGLSLAETKDAGLDPAFWQTLAVDVRLPYQSPLSWYALLRPVGNPSDKEFLHGWREFFGQVEDLLQRNKFRFSVYDHTLVFPLEGLRQVRSYCRDHLQLVERLKKEAPRQYWPCVMAVVDRKGLPLNEDLPDKAGVAWSHLIPDYPHMSARNALMLGDEFTAHEVRFSPAHCHPDDWASVSLKSGKQERGAMPQLAPANLIFGNYEPCFYCGQRSHLARHCPSRRINAQMSDVWQKVARLDLSQIGDAVNGLDKRLSAFETEPEKIAAIDGIVRESGPEADMARAYYDILWPVQLRAISFFWRARDKDLQKAAKKLALVDENPLWEVLRTFPVKDGEALDLEMKKLSSRNSGNDFRQQSLNGFIAVEKGDLDTAEKCWKEAEVSSPHPIVQSWHLFLQARCLESKGSFLQASMLYGQVFRSCPAWLDAEYRRAVCLVKSGFSESAAQSISSLIDASGHFFNRALIDPELERGYIQVLSMLHGLWTAMEERAKTEAVNLNRMRGELGAWFLEDNPFANTADEHIQKVLALASVNNFVAFQLLVSGRMRLEKDIQAHVMQEAKTCKNTFRSFGARLKDIHEESAWFPFPKALVEFNRSFNEGVANVNWAMAANFHNPSLFRKAQELVGQEEKRLKKLEGRLGFLRVVRDSTLFALSMTETFFWLEIVGCILIFAVLPLFLYYGDRFGFEFAVEAFKQERWQVQKALLILVSAFALAFASLRTILRFEVIREKILTKAQAGSAAPDQRKQDKRRKK